MSAWFPLTRRPAVPALVVLMLVSVAGTFGGIQNGGFESGTLSEWTLNAPLYLDWQGADYMPLGAALAWYDPAHAHEGSYYALLINDNPALPPGLKRLSLRQEIQAERGQTLSGWAGFATGDWLYADDAWVRIFDQSKAVAATPWSSAGVAYQQAHYSPWASPPETWEFWSWSVPQSGTYTIELGTSTWMDGEAASYAMFDDITVTYVPEPRTTLLLALGLSAVWAGQRRGRSQQQSPSGCQHEAEPGS